MCKGEKNLLLLLCAAFDLAYERMRLSLQMWHLGLVVCLAVLGLQLDLMMLTVFSR